MTAEIVHHIARTPVPLWSLAFRAYHKKQIRAALPVVAGQLWERIGEHHA